MLRRVFFLLIAAGIAYVVYRVRKRLIFEASPTAPELWHRLAQSESRLTEVIAVHDRLIKLVERHQKGDERRRLLDDVHGCAEAIAELVERHQDLKQYMRDSAGARHLPELQARRDRLDTEIDDSLSNYQQVYADMLAALERDGSGEKDAAKRTHDLLEGLQRRAKAEREIAQAMRDTE